MMMLSGSIIDLPKMSASFSELKGLVGKIGAETINIGEDGATFFPSVSEEGVISWTNDKELPNPEPINIKGKTPQKGVDYWTEADKTEIVNSVIKELPEIKQFETDETLSFENNILSVNTAHEPDPDNTLPITAAAVAATVGNIEILLGTI